jgi:hypothetical protein
VAQLTVPSDFAQPRGASPQVLVDGYDLSVIGSRRPGSDGSGRIDDTCSTPDPTKYHDPSSQFTTIDGAPLSSKMRPGRFGLRGTIIPRASVFGGSQGWHPYKHADNRVNVVDPWDSRFNVTVDLARVTPESAKEALRVVSQAAGPPASMDDLRDRQSAAFHVLSQLSERIAPRVVNERGLTIAGGTSTMQFGPPRQPPPLQQPAPVQAPPVAAVFGQPAVAPPPPQPLVQQQWAPPPYQHQQPQQPWQQAAPAQPSLLWEPQSAPQLPVNPMQAFNKQAAAPALSPGPYAAPAVSGPPPTRKVTIGTRDGDMEAYFHDVIRQPGPGGQGGLLILGLREDYRGLKFIPKVPERKPDGTVDALVMFVEGQSSVLKVEHTGAAFPHNGTLLILFEVLEERAI